VAGLAKEAKVERAIVQASFEAADPENSEANAVRPDSAGHKVKEELKAHADHPVGAGRVTTVDGVVELQEDRLDGMEEVGITDMAHGGHPDGTDPDIIQVMAQTSVPAGVLVGCLSQVSTSFQFQFRSQTALGAIVRMDPMSTEAQMLITALKSSTTRVAMI